MYILDANQIFSFCQHGMQYMRGALHFELFSSESPKSLRQHLHFFKKNLTSPLDPLFSELIAFR